MIVVYVVVSGLGCCVENKEKQKNGKNQKTSKMVPEIITNLEPSDF